MNERLAIATQILNGICSADWKFDLPQGMKWDDVAVIRAYELADKLIAGQKAVTVAKPARKKKSEAV